MKPEELVFEVVSDEGEVLSFGVECADDVVLGCKVLSEPVERAKRESLPTLKVGA